MEITAASNRPLTKPAAVPIPPGKYELVGVIVSYDHQLDGEVDERIVDEIFAPNNPISSAVKAMKSRSVGLSLLQPIVRPVRGPATPEALSSAVCTARVSGRRELIGAAHAEVVIVSR